MLESNALVLFNRRGNRDPGPQRCLAFCWIVCRLADLLRCSRPYSISPFLGTCIGVAGPHILPSRTQIRAPIYGMFGLSASSFFCNLASLNYSNPRATIPQSHLILRCQ